MRQASGFSAAFALVLLAGAAGAEVVNATGKVDWLLNAPSDARLRGNGSISGSMLARGWDEAQNLTLANDLIVDAVNPGFYDRPSLLGTHAIAAGTEISSHAILLKPPGSLAVAEAKLSFDSEIIGVIVTDATSSRRRGGRLAASDWLGSATLFDSGILNRGLEIGSDTFQISADRLSITFNFNASNPGDFARIITRSSEQQVFDSGGFGGSSGMLLLDWGPTPIPSPGALALFGIACCLPRPRRR